MSFSPKSMTSRTMAAKFTRLPVPNRHIAGQGHHRAPQKH